MASPKKKKKKRILHHFSDLDRYYLKVSLVGKLYELESCTVSPTVTEPIVPVDSVLVVALDKKCLLNTM